MKQTQYSLTILRKRLFAICLAIAFLFCIFLSRFFYVQVIWEEELVYRALDQWTREIPVVAERGRISDRNGELLAGNESAYSVFARANAVTDPENCAQTLSVLLEIPREQLLQKLTDRSRSEVTLVRQAEKSVVQKIAGTGYAGVYYARDNKRVYPYGALACQILGFVSADQSGASGVEKYYDRYLAGENGEVLFEADLVGAELEGTGAVYLPAVDGVNLELTLDYRIQALCEETMGRVLGESGAAGVGCIVLDPTDFSVLAMVNLPSYDLNDIPRDDIDALNALSRNRLVSDVYEPGSTFKIVTAAANIEEYLRGNPAAFSAEYIFSSSRTRMVDGSKVSCWSDHKNGKHYHQTLSDALNNSCNPCFVDIALSLGKETFYDYLEAFRFGTATGIDFPGETLGMLLPESTLKNGDLARVAFGQTIAVTPLQLACASATAVNGGYYYAPHLLQSVFTQEGEELYRAEKVLLGRTVSEEASRILSEMLEGVVRDGSGKNADIEGYRVAGKTGTAQKYENGQIAQGKYVSSFVGYFPADDPRYLALVIVDEPQGSYYGSVVAAPCAKEIFQGIIDIMGLQP